MLRCSVSYFDFWALNGGKKGVTATPASKGLGPQNPTKKLAHVEVLLGHLLSQNYVPKVSDLGPLLRGLEDQDVIGDVPN